MAKKNFNGKFINPETYYLAESLGIQHERNQQLDTRGYELATREKTTVAAVRKAEKEAKGPEEFLVLCVYIGFYKGILQCDEARLE